MVSETHRRLLRQYAKDESAYQELISLFDQQNKSSQIKQIIGDEFDFLQSAPASIVITDATAPDNPVIFANEHFTLETGYSFSDIEGKNLRQLQADDRDQPEIKIMQDAIAKGEPCHVTLRNYRKDGTMFWNELFITPIRDEKQTIHFFIGVQHDVSERINLQKNALADVEKKFEHSEMLYRQLVENSLHAISLHHPNGLFIYVNNARIKLLGYTQQEYLNMTLDDINLLIHPEDIARVQAEAHAQVLQGKAVTQVQYRLRCKDGRYIWVENFSVPIINQNGEVEQILATAYDISVQKEAEQALKISMERSNALIEAIPDLMFRFDQEGKFLDVQANLKDLYAPPEVVLNNTIRDILPPPVAEQAMLNIRQTLESRTMQSFQYQLVIPELGLREYEARMVPSGDNEVIAIMRDVSDLKATQFAYERSRDRSQKLIQAIPDLIFLIRRDGMYLDYEADTSDLYYQGDELIGKTIAETAPTTFTELAMHHIEEALKTGDMQTFEYQLPMPERGMLDYEARIVPIDENEVISYVRDITASKRSQQRELELMLEKERRKLLTDFIRNAAHEFRTPLTSISTSAHIMVQTDDKERQRQKALKIEQQVHRLTRLLDMLLLMMRLNNTEILPKTRIDVADFHESICTEIQRQNKQRHHIECQYLIQADAAMIMGNSELLYEAIMQVFDNAQRFTPDNGTIRLNVHNDDSRLLFEISDTGVGIEEDALQVIFQTFWRQDDVHTTPGFGLGLPIVKEIVKLHGGMVGITSKVNAGTTVTISLPLRQV